MRREIRPTNSQPPARAWLDDEATFDLQEACSLLHLAFVARLRGDLDHAIEHHGRTVGLEQALLERSLPHEKVRMAQGHCFPQIEAITGLRLDLAPHVAPSEQQNGPTW